MREFKVALGWPLSDQLLADLQALSPSLRLEPIADLVGHEIRLLRSSPGSPEQRRATAEMDADLEDAEVLLSRYRLPQNVPGRTPKLKWVHVTGAGVERILDSGLLEAGITLTNSRGVAARPIAEWVLGAMLIFAKRMPLWSHRQQQREWIRADVEPFSLQGKTAGILGLGAIGGEIALLCKAMEMTVLATRRSVAARQGPSASVDILFPASETEEVLKVSDFVVIALPLTPETAGRIGEGELRLVKRSAYLLNIGRGPIVDEAALTRALQEGRIAGATLDVFEQEPLPKESPLWGLENVVVTPHISGNVDGYDARVAKLFRENLRRYLAGEHLLNVVDRDRGY